VCENRALRRLFGPKRLQVTGGWRRLHKEELHKVREGVDLMHLAQGMANGGAL